MRYTEYHAGVAVIKDKKYIQAAVQKLAKIEDEEERQELVLKLAQYCNQQTVCDDCCTFYTDHYCDFNQMSLEQLKKCYKRISKVKNKRICH